MLKGFNHWYNPLEVIRRSQWRYFHFCCFFVLVVMLALVFCILTWYECKAYCLDIATREFVCGPLYVHEIPIEGRPARRTLPRNVLLANNDAPLEITVHPEAKVLTPTSVAKSPADSPLLPHMVPCRPCPYYATSGWSSLLDVSSPVTSPNTPFVTPRSNPSPPNVTFASGRPAASGQMRAGRSDCSHLCPIHGQQRSLRGQPTIFARALHRTETIEAFF